MTEEAKLALAAADVKVFEGASATAYDLMVARFKGVAYGPAVLAMAFIPGMDAVFGGGIGAVGATWGRRQGRGRR